MTPIIPLSAFRDNYIWVILHPTTMQCVVVDPGDASPVLQWLEQKNYTLSGILLTHHHWDHIGGVNHLLNKKSIPVYGPHGLSKVTHPVKDGDTLTLFDVAHWTFNVMAIPGHTLDHIAYFNEKLIFCGDTLFTAGCGRVFEGSMAQMYASLQKLARLPLSAQVYCGHEYTLSNLAFAAIVEPNNLAIQKRIQSVTKQRQSKQASVPAPLAIELDTNPFLRCQEKTVQKAASTHAGRVLTDAISVFSEIRQWKNQY